jgi:Tfp pilus assembly protein PilF
MGISSPDAAARALSLLAQAIAANPLEPSNYLLRARYNLQQHTMTDPSLVRGDFEQALRLNPNDIRVRLEYAAALERFGDRAAATAEYQRALWDNAAVIQHRPDEPKQLSKQEIDSAQQRIAALK